MNSAIATTTGQTITLATIISEVSTRLPTIPPHSVLSAGALGLERLSRTPLVHTQLMEIWNIAICRTMILSLAVICAAVPCAAAMEWLNSRKISEERNAAGIEGASQTSPPV